MEIALAETIQSSLEQAAIDGVQSATVDGQSATQMSIDDRIKAANFIASQTAKSKNHLGLTFRKMEPGGCG